MTYEPGLYQKGDEAHRASSAAEAVNLVFQGFKRVDEDAPEAADTPPADDNVDVSADAPVSPLDGADPEFDEGSPSDDNTSAELDAHQSGYTF